MLTLLNYRSIPSGSFNTKPWNARPATRLMMIALWTVPEKLIVRQFYLQNTGLFLVVLMLACGFLSSVEHIALATYALHDWGFLVTYLIALG
jgi:hypothetical protein